MSTFGHVADRVGRGKNNQRDYSAFFITLRKLANAAAFRTAIGTVNKAGDTMTGALTLGGLLDTGATGQIAFPATQNPSAGANTLDDYEEGGWTPNLVFAGAQVGMTFNSRLGMYVKTGAMVFVSAEVYLNAKGSSTGGAALTGLPFILNSGFRGTLAVGSTNSLSLPAAGLVIPLSNGSSYSDLAYLTTTTSGTITNAHFNNGSLFDASGSYVVA